MIWSWVCKLLKFKSFAPENIGPIIQKVGIGCQSDSFTLKVYTRKLSSLIGKMKLMYNFHIYHFFSKWNTVKAQIFPSISFPESIENPNFPALFSRERLEQCVQPIWRRSFPVFTFPTDTPRENSGKLMPRENLCLYSTV